MSSVLVLVISRAERALCFSKSLSPFVRTYPDLCRDRRRHVRLRPNLAFDLNLNLSLNLFPNLNLNLFLLQKSFQKPFEASFASKFVSDLRLNLNLDLSLFLLRQPPPEQSPVCHPHGRIVVPAVPDHHI